MPKRKGTLETIQELVRNGQYRFTFKAELEMARCWLEGDEVIDAILDAEKIDKIENSYNPYTNRSEKLYVIKNYAFYIKGKVTDQFVIISCKFDTDIG
jgi:hypothetical protein